MHHIRLRASLTIFHIGQKVALNGHPRLAALLMLASLLAHSFGSSNPECAWRNYLIATRAYLCNNPRALVEMAALCGPNEALMRQMYDRLVARGSPAYEKDYFLQ